jgi:hypothetical protein
VCYQLAAVRPRGEEVSGQHRAPEPHGRSSPAGSEPIRRSARTAWVVLALVTAGHLWLGGAVLVWWVSATGVTVLIGYALSGYALLGWQFRSLHQLAAASARSPR